MKKMITIFTSIAAGLLFGAANANSLTNPSGTSFEDLSTGDKNFADIVDNDDSGTTDGSLYWFTAVAEGTDLYTNEVIATVKQYLDDQDEPISALDIPVTNRTAQWASDLNGKYLTLDTSTNLLYRTIKPKQTTLGGAEAQVEIGDGIYLDTLVQFSAADKPFEAGDVAEGDKIAISYVEHESEGDNDPSYTNFVVRAGYVDAANSTIVATNYFLTFPGDPANEVKFDKTEWHRLTVRAISNVGNENAPVGFVVYVDGTNLVYTAESDGCKAAGDPTYVGSLNSVVSTYLYNDENQALLPSLLRKGATNYNTLAAVGFKGNGSVDDISFTADKPGILPVEGTTVTIAWDANVATYTVVAGETTIVDGETVSGKGSTNLLLAAGIETLTVTATYATDATTGIEYKPGTWTVNGAGASISGSTFTIAPGAQLNIVSIYPYFQVGDAYYQKFDGEDGALAAATAGSGVIKLNADYPHDIALTEGTVTIDLAGKTITGDDAAAIINAGADLIITNSTVAIGHIVNPADALAILIGGGTTSIYGGWIDGQIDFDTEEAFTDLLFLYGGYYVDVNSATTTDAFYLNAYAKDDVSYVDDPAYYFQVGSDTPEPPAPTTYALTLPTGVNATATVTAGGVEVANIGAIEANTEIVVTWTADSGYKITAGATENITMNSDKEAATPTVVVITYATLTIDTVANCTIVVSNATEEVATGTTFDKDDAVQLTVYRTPAEGYELDNCAATETITMDQNQTVTAAVKQSGGSNWPSTWNSGTQPASMVTAFNTWIAAGNDPTAANAEAAFLVGVNVADYKNDFAAASISIVGGKIVITGNYNLSTVYGALSVKMGDAPNALGAPTAVTATEGAITLAPALGETKKFYKLVIGYPAE